MDLTKGLFPCEAHSCVGLVAVYLAGFEPYHQPFSSCSRSHSFKVSFVSFSPVFQKRKRFMVSGSVFGIKVSMCGVPSGKSAEQMREG